MLGLDPSIQEPCAALRLDCRLKAGNDKNIDTPKPLV
jgi:hypothetical protein